MKQNNQAEMAMDVIVGLSSYGNIVNPGMLMRTTEVDLTEVKLKLDKLFGVHQMPEGAGSMTVGAFLRHWNSSLEFNYSLPTMTDEERERWKREQREADERREEEKNRMVQYTQELRSDNPKVAGMVDCIIKMLINEEMSLLGNVEKMGRLTDIERNLLALFKIRCHYVNHSECSNSAPFIEFECNRHCMQYLRDSLKGEHAKLRMKYQELTGIKLHEYTIIFYTDPVYFCEGKGRFRTPTSAEEKDILARLHQVEEDLRSLEDVLGHF